jgi:hypothetical protein
MARERRRVGLVQRRERRWRKRWAPPLESGDAAFVAAEYSEAV